MGAEGPGCCQRILHTKWARNMKRRSMKTPPIQVRKFRVILGELISFLSMSHANSVVEGETSGVHGRRIAGPAFEFSLFGDHLFSIHCQHL